MKKIIPALCLLLISATLLGTSTFAWFSMNRSVSSSGMKVKAAAEGSIVISNTVPAAGTKATDYAFADADASALYASTHDSTFGTYATGLKRVSNAENINPETGMQKNSTATLTWGAAENSTTVLYYKDYTLYIAGDGQAFDHQDLAVTLQGSWLTAGKTINKAISVDFYGEAVTTQKTPDISATNYLGTLNLAGVKNDADGKSTTAHTTFTVSDINIPAANGNAAYAVTMRVYFDGALIETAGAQTYTEYEAATGTAVEGTYYYTDANGSSVATVATGAPVTGLFVAKSTSTKTFARTTAINNIEDVTLVATFSASNH